MIATKWAIIAEKYHAGKIDEYDKWRYYYPQYDDTQITAKVPSQELSDAMVKAFKKKLKDRHLHLLPFRTKEKELTDPTKTS